MSPVTWVSECAGKRTARSGLALVPKVLDVCGNALPDVLVLFTSSADGGAMRVLRLPTAPAAMPLKIEAVIDDPRSGTSSDAAFGYDASASNAPSSFNAEFHLTGTGSAAMDISVTSAAALSLAVLGEVFQPDAARARTRPQRMRLGYAGPRDGGDLAAWQLVHVDGVGRDRGSTAYEDRAQTSGHRALDATIDRQLAYTAGQPTTRVELNATGLPFQGRPRPRRSV